jgi:NAD(P)-dependent dehydrogenase (short-subunit alcohol dehydrogenase family)/acyl-CoA thioesterase FadM
VGAFAASLHFERPDLQIRALDFDPESAPDVIAARILAEIASGGAFVRAGYDLSGERRIPVAALEEPALWPSRGLAWSESDVILVTGGARGVTAECALAFAESRRTRMALVGSSAPDAEIEAILARYAAAGLTARYHRCDVRDAGAVATLVEKVGEELGPVTGLIHGAGVNKPRRAEQADAASAAAEVGPKLQGALNLLAALERSPPKLIAGLSSIIGVTGMPGNAFYAFSNEALNVVFKNFALRHPATQVVSLAYSVWSDIGMGARMGSGKALGRMGVGAIPAVEGVARFLHLMERDPGAAEIVVTAQLRGLDSWSRPVPPKPARARFLENVDYFEPGVELRLRPHLSFDRDPYLADHIFKGSALFPTVFGLEAMAQAAAWATGRERIGDFAFETISLDRPIVVDPEKGATIEIRALVREREGADAPQRIDLEIGAEQTGFSAPHFAATLVLGDAAPVAEMPDFPAERLDIEPRGDLYGWLLFQGPMFQRLNGVFALDSRRALLTSAQEQTDYLLGDPYFRDSLLQSAQLTVPQHVCLPLRIERLAGRGGSAPGKRRIEAVFDGFVPGDDRHLLAHVAAFDQEGATLETISGYRLAVLERRSDHPAPEQIAAPDAYDAESLRGRIGKAAAGFGLSAPALALSYGRWHDLDRTARREAETRRLIRLLAEAGVSEPISWSDSGPQLPEPAGFGLSLSHDSRLCLFVAGPGRQGCDLAPLICRSAPEWLDLLGESRAALLAVLQGGGDDRDRAGTRFWAALEAGRKIFQATPDLNVAERDGDAVLFDARAPGGEKATILTLPWSGLRGGSRMVAITVVAAKKKAETKDFEFHLDVHGASIGAGPQGQVAYALRFPLSFRETSYASRRLYYCHYFDWMGKLREAACRPVYEHLVADFSSGRWGMVTNFAETRIFSDAGAEDGMEGRVWLAGLSGAQGERMDLCYEWTALRPDGRRDLAARGRMAATWVEILDHGVVKARPLPDYLRDAMERFSPPSPALGGWEVGARPDLGATMRQGAARPDKRLLLKETRRDTSLRHSNLVGNIYFANYSAWQGETIDAWIASFAPETLRGTGDAGEFFCAYSRIEHLREAMPFETIVVRMSLGALHEKGVALLFDFFRETPAGEKQKLAWGEADLAWTERDGDGHWRAAMLPEEYARKICARFIEPV